ncbi:MAG TPA: gamma-glutamyltransferase [Nitrolancea sp.]|jgi:gamma-glutamyltranspeptidase/glutathione hydrolase|nr:gamma-glutamyltransferase [Nitrolancea sp.]
MVWPNEGLTHRPYVAGRRGAVASAHPLASQAGLSMLQQGGNAIDAIVATAATLNVVEPFMSGAAGVGYMVIKPAGATKPIVLDFIGHAPGGATPDRFQEAGSKDFGILSPLVPGSLAGWLTALERFGSLDRATVFAPAIEYAEHGYPVTVKNYLFMSSARERLLNWETSSRAYLLDGETPKPGAILKQPELANTFRTIVEGGIEAFYRGPIAQEITAFSGANGGLLTAEDLAAYEPTWQEPISTTYHGYTVYCPALPCSGMQYLETLNLVEGFDLAAMGHNSADYIHHLAEAIKLAVADRTTYAPNPESPIERLLSKEYAAQRRTLIDPMKAGYSGGERYTSTKHEHEVLPGSFSELDRESTTHFVAADAAGNAVACTQTLGAPFGSAVVHGNTGLMLNNFAHWFDLDPQSPNVIAPYKKVEMCLAPSQIWHDDKLFLMVGTPGSFGIMQTTPQMMLNVLDHQYSIQAAIEAPRFRTGDGTELLVEGRVTAEVLDALRQRGHQVRVLDDWTPLVGGGQGILIDPESDAFSAGADPRRDGYGLAF